MFNAVIIHFYFQCVQMTMNNILTSGGLTEVYLEPSQTFNMELFFTKIVRHSLFL